MRKKKQWRKKCETQTFGKARKKERKKGVNRNERKFFPDVLVLAQFNFRVIKRVLCLKNINFKS